MKYKKEFETSCLFRDDMLKGDFATCKDGSEYMATRVQRMYNGYAMAMDARLNAVDRCNPDRYLSNGFFYQLNELLPGNPLTEEQIRAVLKVAGANPV